MATSDTTKTKAPTKAQIENELKETKDALAEAMALIKELKEQKVVTPQVVVQSDNKHTSKIKCINLAHNPVNISTLPDGGGRMFTFNQYGQAHFIKYDDLLDIVSAYPNTMESGLIYVADKDFCEENGLYDQGTIYTKELLDKIVYLRDDIDVDLLKGMSKPLLETTITEIARLYHNGEYMEPNKLAVIKNDLGFDIEAMADDVIVLEDDKVK